MALGMGFDALFSDRETDSKDIRTLRISEIEPNKSQPRKDFDTDSINELADSIREHGLIQPIVVRENANGMTYQIVAGERRWRACRIAGLNEVPVIIRELTDEQVSQIAIIENVQRADLNPIEEAMAYKDLITKYNMTQEAVAKVIGKSRSYIANLVRMLNAPEYIQNSVREGKISAGHAKALMSIEDEEKLSDAFERVVGGRLNVRQTEQLASEIASSDAPAPAKKEEKQFDNFCTEMELSLRKNLGRKVKISSKPNGKGTISIDFFDKEDLVRISEYLVKMEEDNEKQ